MKVLFAVNNDEISNAIKKRYQEKYKDIFSYKNVYYFNAILKELQKDKTYDRIVISEDLEPFANNNYDTIDKFLFDRLDSISDETTNADGNNADIILICTDRRSKSDEILTKFFGIGIYSAIIGQDRSIDEVINLIYRPRNKKDAKQYYKIDLDKVDYQAENENDVNEAEIQNILAHYKRLGKNEEKYVDSFNNIVSQYNDIQLKIIIKYLPLNVKAVLEEKSPKYQELTVFSNATKTVNELSKKSLNNYKGKEETVKVRMLREQSSNISDSRPIVIPSSVSKNNVKKLIKEQPLEQKNEENILETLDDIDDIDTEINEIEKNIKNDNEQEKRKRGRPAKLKEEKTEEPKEKKGRGRPRKNLIEERNTAEDEEIDLFNLDDEEEAINKQDEAMELFNLDDEEKNSNEQDEEIDLFNLDDEEDINQKDEEIDLFNLDDEEENSNQQDKEMNLSNLNEADNNKQSEGLDLFNLDDDSNGLEPILNNKKYNDTSYNTQNNKMSNTNNISKDSGEFIRLLTKEKKVVCFVGTTKNGTSFLINNVGELLASMGISTAILDMTTTKNAYYIYTNNNEKLRQIASESISKLKNGVANGIEVNRNLAVFTNLPGEDRDYSNATNILSTLVKKYSVVLIDCDFNTPIDYFDKAQEIYLVQSMDVLTIQPLTAFLRDLKTKKVLKPEKLKVIINKEQRVKSLSAKTLIGGIAFYNDPTMSYMTELFNKDKIPYCVIPFEMQNYSKYLNSLVECSVTLDGYTKTFMEALKELANMIYPLINRQTYSPRGEKYKEAFSNETNDTLNKMKRKYQ